MPHRSQTITALTRVLIGLAWRDGRVTAQEMALLKDLTFGLPELSQHDWEDLNIYWITPIGERELRILEQDLYAALQSIPERAIVINLLEALTHLDGEVSPEEAALLTEAQHIIQNGEGDLLGVLEALLHNAVPRRASQIKNTRNEGDYVRDDTRNKVFHELHKRYGADLEGHFGLDEIEIRKLALAGTLMGRVAYADSRLDTQEAEAIHNLIEGGWGLKSNHAEVVVDFTLDAARHPLDYPRLTREFYESTSYQERLEFLDVLFEVAYTHQGISHAEANEIERISRALKVDYTDYADIQRRSQRYERYQQR